MTHKITLSAKDEQELRRRLKKESQVKIHRRLKSIEYRIRGIRNQDIASILGVSKETISVWAKLFLNEGFEGLCHLKYEGRRPSSLDAHKEAIKNYIREKAPSTLAQLNDWLEKSYGLTAEETWLSRYCKKNSLFPVKRRSLPRVKLLA